MDLRGHGTSSPSAGDYSLAELAADVLNVMDNLAFARVHLVGTSVGSMVAQYLGATAGHRLISLTLVAAGSLVPEPARSEEHTSELQSLMRISYAVFCLKKKNKNSSF